MPTLPDDWHPRDERDARIEELEEENERLKAALAEAVGANSRKEIRIEAALAECERTGDCGDKSGPCPCSLPERVVKALK